MSLKQLLPSPVRSLARRVRLIALRRRFGRMPIDQVFSQIYRTELWGSDVETGYCSGLGSRGEVATAYIDFVLQYVRQHDIRSIVDLGCGDFFIGSKIAGGVESYVGVDVVPELIRDNTRRYASTGIEFVCIDIIKDPLPQAECCLIRQVFQHLSNSEIAEVLGKLSIYKHVLVTEHHPSPSRLRTFNKDKPHGPDTRVVDDSGIFLDQPPFSISVKEVFSVAASPRLVAEGEQIKTFAIINRNQ